MKNLTEIQKTFLEKFRDKTMKEFRKNPHSTPERISGGIPLYILGGTPEKIPGEVLGRILKIMLAGISERILSKIPREFPGEILG